MDEKMKNILLGAVIGFGVSYVVLDNMAARDSMIEDTPPTVEEAAAFLSDVETEIAEFGAYASKIYWVQANFMTTDTTALAADAVCHR